MKNVLVTGAASPLARELLLQLRRFDKPERIFASDRAHPARCRDIEQVSLGHDQRAVVDFLAKNEIDTVVHCGLAPDRSGSHDGAREAGVIDTMRLGAAIAHDAVQVRAWVVASSSSVYTVSSQAPFLQREDGAAGEGLGPLAESLLEAEDYVRDIAEQAPYLNVSILRLQQLVGDGAESPLAAVLRQPILPRVIGYNPALQLLALEDAARALAFAAELQLAGVYNVASAGLLRFGEAVQALRKPTLPVLPLEAGPFTGLARRLGIPHVPDGLLDILRFGHVLDTAKFTAAGFEPDYSQAACLRKLAE